MNQESMLNNTDRYTVMIKILYGNANYAIPKEAKRKDRVISAFPFCLLSPMITL